MKVSLMERAADCAFPAQKQQFWQIRLHFSRYLRWQFSNLDTSGSGQLSCLGQSMSCVDKSICAPSHLGWYRGSAETPQQFYCPWEDVPVFWSMDVECLLGMERTYYNPLLKFLHEFHLVSFSWIHLLLKVLDTHNAVLIYVSYTIMIIPFT